MDKHEIETIPTIAPYNWQRIERCACNAVSLERLIGVSTA